MEWRQRLLRVENTIERGVGIANDGFAFRQEVLIDQSGAARPEWSGGARSSYSDPAG